MRFVKRSTLLLILILPFYAFGQVSIAAYLKTALSNDKVGGYQHQLDFLEEGKYGLPPIKKLEFRTKNDEFVREEQEYALRVSPASPWQIKANKRTFEAREQLLKTKQLEELNDALEDNYENVVAFIKLNEKGKIEEQKLALIKKEIEIYEQQTKSRSFDPQDIIDARIEMIEQLTVIAGHKGLVDDAAQLVMFSFEDPSLVIDWSYEDVLTVQQLIKVVDKIKGVSISTAEERVQQQEINLLSEQIKLEKSKRNIGFVQTDYIPSRTNKTPFAISLGFSIPIFNENKPDMADKRLDQIEEEGRLNEVKQELKRDEVMAFRKFMMAIKRHDDLKSVVADASDAKYSNTLLMQEKHNPATVLKLQRSMLKLESQLLETKGEVYQTYIDYISTKGVMMQESLVNFLSPTLEEL